MVSRNIRSETIPAESTIISSVSLEDNSYTDESTLFSKYIKSVPNSCTNPGSSIGGTTHDHGSCGTSHSHGSPSSSPHTHTTIISSAKPFPGGICTPGTSGPTTYSSSSHTHNYNFDTIASTLTRPASTHNHPTAPNEATLKNVTVRYETRNASLNIRANTLPDDSVILWTDSLATIPDGFSHYASLDDAFTKGIASGAGTPGCTSPASPVHTHSSVAHTHPVTIPSHTHAITVSVTTQTTNGGTGGAAAIEAHTPWHPGGAGPATPSVQGSLTSSPDSHSHTASDIPKHHTTTYIKSSGNIRKSGIPDNASIIWLNTLATIPTGFLLNDGTSCTSNMLDRYARGVLNPTTEPGPQGGNDTHSHNASHSHCPGNVSHSHPGFTTLANGPPSNVPTFSIPVDPGIGPRQVHGLCATNHNHTLCPTTPSSSVAVTFPSSPHTHTTVDHRPDTIEVAFISRR